MPWNPYGGDHGAHLKCQFAYGVVDRGCTAGLAPLQTDGQDPVTPLKATTGTTTINSHFFFPNPDSYAFIGI